MSWLDAAWGAGMWLLGAITGLGIARHLARRIDGSPESAGGCRPTGSGGTHSDGSPRATDGIDK